MNDMPDQAAPDNISQFPGSTGAAAVAAPAQEQSPDPNDKAAVDPRSVSDLPQGFQEFYDHVQSATANAFVAAAPFQGKHPAIDQSLGEVLRYLELSIMYMDRLMLYVKNPQLLRRPAPEKADGPAGK